MRIHLIVGLLATVAGSLGGCSSCEEEPTGEQTPAEPAPPIAEPLEALPEHPDFDERKMALGRRLYFDARLSSDNTLSCASCHSLDHGGAEATAVSTGVNGAQGPINSPTVLNSRFNFVQFWDGRAADLEAQAAGPVANPIEMGSQWDQVVEELRAVPEYVAQFAAIYNDGITQANVTNAIAEYERSLVTPSRFDAFLRGDTSALNEQEQRGYATFKETGCPTCHLGVNAGGTMYQKMGLARDWFATLSRPLTEADNGRFNVTHAEADRHFFKVPTLRNVELTWPYLHDGSQRELADVVRVMASFQLGKDLTDGQVNDIVAFLRALTGELPAHARLPEDDQVPVLPSAHEGEGEGEGEGEAPATGDAPAAPAPAAAGETAAG
jgi:cytochrome c peroxidase